MSTFLDWAMFFMIKYPNIQAKVHEDIRTQIGSRQAALSDRANTHYVEAVIEEMMR